ncbi:Polynucleotidyl transferase- ribonuclease H-like superfamily protein [Striga hermonthica]|uniref:Polynucleotidyl transferase- ribonuclease H-like superfamily protein n=1 Tax=Striga hermonthica TaxID=68872 RepID=A0A9N7MHA1_STRHE|nr:Polynucleotidyl transferase- ribonuclease H-like superfamily protein [Striga hermonthica]
MVLWLAAKNRLLTNAERSRRHVAVSSACELYGDDETTLHVFRDFPSAKEVWQGYFQLIENWNTLFAITVWCMWRWRNERIFKHQFPAIAARLMEIRRSSTGYTNAAAAFSSFGAVRHLV